MIFMKKPRCSTIITVLFVCLTYPFLAELVDGRVVLSGELYNITTINVCFDDILVEIRSENDSVDYQIVDCVKEESLWKCSCKNPTTLYLKVEENASNVYDVFIQYWVAPLLEVVKDNMTIAPTFEEIENDNNKRTKSFNNIRFGPAVPPPKPKEPFKAPDTENIGFVFIILFIVFLFFGGLIFVAWRWVSKDGEDDFNKKIKKTPSDNIDNSEAVNYLRKYVK